MWSKMLKSWNFVKQQWSACGRRQTVFLFVYISASGMGNFPCSLQIPESCKKPPVLEYLDPSFVCVCVPNVECFVLYWIAWRKCHSKIKFRPSGTWKEQFLWTEPQTAVPRFIYWLFHKSWFWGKNLYQSPWSNLYVFWRKTSHAHHFSP